VNYYVQCFPPSFFSSLLSPLFVGHALNAPTFPWAAPDFCSVFLAYFYFPGSCTLWFPSFSALRCHYFCPPHRQCRRACHVPDTPSSTNLVLENRLRPSLDKMFFFYFLRSVIAHTSCSIKSRRRCTPPKQFFLMSEKELENYPRRLRFDPTPSVPLFHTFPPIGRLFGFSRLGDLRVT